MSRTYKRPYTKSKRFDTSCRNHGSCSWCTKNRLYSSIKQPTLKEQISIEELQHLFN